MDMDDTNPTEMNPPPVAQGCDTESHNAEESNSSSLTLSLTPPLSNVPENNDSSTISEHISSVENDRSIQEIEVTNLPKDFPFLIQSLPTDDERISQEPKPPSLNSSFNTTNSIISLTGLERFISNNMEGSNSAKSILEEILNNEQFKSDTESREDSLEIDIFANVDLSDKILNTYNLEKSADFNLGSMKNDSLNNLSDVCRKVRQFEEIIAVKDSTIAALTCELDSFKEMLSNPSSNSPGTSTTEYRQYQEECHNKLVEYHSAISHKDEQIDKLTAALQQSISMQKELKQHFRNEISQLHEQLEKTSTLLKEHRCDERGDVSFDEEFSKLEATLNTAQLNLFNDFKATLNSYIENKMDEKRRTYENEIHNLKIKLEADKTEHNSEIARLRSLLSNLKHGSTEILELKQELDAKHSQEMEELRTYFEKKCSDLEKNYSEEIFSQQSRKMSAGSSSLSESELPSDFVGFNQPGPGGDSKIDYTKKDLIKLRQDLNRITSVMDGFNLADLKDDEFDLLKNEINKFDLRSLIKYDLISIRSELQNKYHAELEILREDFDNRVDILNVEHENKIKSLERKYCEEIDDLNHQLQGRINTATVQEVMTSGEFEIDEVVQSYERRLQEQVTLAKIDIIAALENQIQRLASSDSIDDDWPEELLRLKARFAEKYQEEIEKMHKEHRDEIARLKEDHVKSLNGALERARRRSLRDSDSLNKGELELLHERDCLKKQTSSLRKLLAELLKYFTQCEDELNNTLVEELVTKNLTQIEDDLNLNSSDISVNIKRVHLTPNFGDLINLIDNSQDNDLESIDLKGELGMCLEKLKADATAILALSNHLNRDDRLSIASTKSLSLDKEVTSLTRKLISETQLKNELFEQMEEAKSIIKSLESDRSTMENQLEQILEHQKIVESDLLKAQGKIAELIENGHKEIVSEGYGEEGRKTIKGMMDVVAGLGELQEKARSILENSSGLDVNCIQLIEDFIRLGDKIIEESRKDRDDFKQQIEAADKKYRVTCQFLEDQATEREQERDEAQKEIDALKEQLKDRDRDRVNCERMTNEVENLEQQLREMSRLMGETEQRCKEIEDERTEAVDKIYELRDIIRELEDQVKVKTQTEEELRGVVVELEAIVRQQVDHEDEHRYVETATNVEELHQYIGNLEGEVQRLRLNTEIAGSEGVDIQIRNHLCDFETTLDKRTKDLEGLHTTISTTCNSPSLSEDMSIRDVVHPSSVYDECEVPLQQLARLKEKLIRHSRAEDAAVKRIKDIEMQFNSLKCELEECQSDREILRKQNSDHLVLISNLQIRLDEQRIRAEHIEKQTNTSLECQIYDLKTTINSLEDELIKRDKTINLLKNTMEEMKQKLKKHEDELSSNKEADIIAHMQEQVESLRSENYKLKSCANQHSSHNQMLPNLFENIISDKNNVIEILKEKLATSEQKLQIYSSLNLDKSQIDVLNKLRSSGLSFEDLLDLSENVQVRRAQTCNETLTNSPPFKRNQNETIYLGVEAEISNIDKDEDCHRFYSLQAPAGKSNSTEKHVRFEDESEEAKIDKLQQQLKEKNQEIDEYMTRLRGLEELEGKIGKLQTSLEETEKTLKKVSDDFEEEQKKHQQNEENLRKKLDNKLLEVNGKNEELEVMHTELQSTLEKLNKLQNQLTMQDETLKSTKNAENVVRKQLEKKVDELKDYDMKIRLLSDELVKSGEEIEKLHSIISDKDSCVTNLKSESVNLNKELVHLQQLIVEKEKIIAQMSEDSESLHANLETIQLKLQESGNIVDLGRRLRDEQRKNSELIEELHGLKAQLLFCVDRKSIDDITGQVQKQLDYSAYLDSALINAVSDSNSNENCDVDTMKLALKKQKAVNKHLVKVKDQALLKAEDLEGKYNELMRVYEELKVQLEKERFKLSTVQLDDAKLIEQLRIRLDSALDNEHEYEKILEAEKKDRIELENQLISMKQKISALNSTSSRTDTTEYKQIQSQDSRLAQRKIEILKEENEKLSGELRKIKLKKSELEADFKYAQDLIRLKNEEVGKCEERMDGMQENEKQLKDKLSKMKEIIEQKEKEIENTRILIDEVDDDRKLLKKQLDVLNKKLKTSNRKSSDSDLTAPVPEQILQRIKELKSSVSDNLQMMDIITRLTNEKSVLEERIVALERPNNIPFDDPSARANYLFAKFLRAESYRKALIWQKRYLTSLLESYQSLNDVSRLIPELQLNTIHPNNKRSTGLNRFKRLGLMLIALSRMKYLVRRWHSGRRIVQQRHPHQVDTNLTTHFQVGQPVSQQNFSKTAQPKSALIDPHVLQFGLSFSPPTKDVPSSSSSSKVVFRSAREPLISPGLLSRYVDRFSQIQDRLGLDVINQ